MRARSARAHGLPLVAARRRAHARARRRALQDALTAIRLDVPLAEAGCALYPERRAPPARRARGSRSSIRRAAGRDPGDRRALRLLARRAALRVSARARARGRDAASLPAQARPRQGARAALAGGRARPTCATQIEHELALIAELRYEPYFLTVHDIVAMRARRRHPVPGPRLGRQFRRLLLPRHHRGRSRRACEHAVRALHLEGAQRAARHRRRLRARAARGGHPVHLPQVRPRPRRARRHGHHLPAAQRACATSARRSGSIAAQVDRARAARCSGGTAATSTPSACARRASIPTNPQVQPLLDARRRSCSAFRAICRSTSAAS